MAYPTAYDLKGYQGNPIPLTIEFDTDQTGLTVLAQVRDNSGELVGTFTSLTSTNTVSLTWTPDVHGKFDYDVSVGGIVSVYGRVEVQERISHV